jgi:2-hydroxychromene-2-carboxylate isomerase
MSFVVDLFFSFRSPYSYLALTKTRRMVDMYDVVVRLRSVYPIAVCIPNFFKNANPSFAKYVHLDSARVGRHDGIPFRLPRPDPIVQNMTTLEVAAEQPYIGRGGWLQPRRSKGVLLSSPRPSLLFSGTEAPMGGTKAII